jgi:hypothetical protein
MGERGEREGRIARRRRRIWGGKEEEEKEETHSMKLHAIFLHLPAEVSKKWAHSIRTREILTPDLRRAMSSPCRYLPLDTDLEMRLFIAQVPPASSTTSEMCGLQPIFPSYHITEH